MALGESLRAYADLDMDQFALHMDEVGVVTPCLGEVVAPALAADFHRLAALRLHVAGNADPDALSSTLAAARAVDPAFMYTDDVLPPNDAFRFLFQAASAGRGRTRRLPEPQSGHFAFDGEATRERPIDRATLLQVVDGAGAVVFTGSLLPRDDVPPYEAIPRTRRALLRTALGEAMIAGALLATSSLYAGRLFDEDRTVTSSQLAHERNVVNGLFWVSVGVGGASIGSAVAGVAVGQR